MVGIPIDLIISDYTLSVEMKIIEGVAILSLNVSKLIYNNTFLKSYVSKKKGIKILAYVTLHCYKDIIG